MGRHAKIPSFKLFGGKSYLEKWIRSYFPPHDVYIEPFGGAGTVLLNKDKSKVEIYSDANAKFVAILKEIKANPKEFIAKLSAIPYTQENFEKAQASNADAVDWLIIQRWSRSGMGKNFSWGKNRQRGGKPESINAWENFVGAIPKISERLKDTALWNQNYQKTITNNLNNGREKEFPLNKRLIYADPPYLPSTRATKDVYEYDMKESEHMTMLEYFTKIANPYKIIISGYESDLYNDTLKGWRLVKKDIANNSGQGKTLNRRTECLYYNF